MSALGSLVVKLALDYAEYMKGLDRTSQEALKFAKSTQTSFDTASRSTAEFFVGTATGAVSAATSFLTVRAAIDGLTNSIATLEKLDDMAQKTGSSVENLSRIQKTIQAFGGDFNSVDTALSKLAKGMATADSEANRTNQALKALGISSRDAAGNLRDPSEVMVDISKKLQNYSDGAGKSALANDLFGRSGADILPVLNDIAENIQKFVGVSAAAAQKASEFTAQVGQLNLAYSDLYETLAAGVLPAFTDITKSMVDATKQGGIFQGMLAGIGALSKNMFNTDRLLPQDQKIVARLQDIQGAMDDILDTRKKWYMPSNYADGELQSLNLEAIALQKELALLQAVGKEKDKEKDKPQLPYQSGSSGKSEVISAYERATKAAADYIQRLQQETEAVGLNAVQQKLLAASREAAKAPLESQRLAIMTEANAWAATTQAQEQSLAVSQALEAEEKKRLDGYAALVSADEKSLASLIEKNNLLEFGTAAIQAMGQADLQAALDRAWASDNVDPEVISMLQQRLDLSKQIAEETLRGEGLQAAKDAAKAADDEWTRVGQSIEQTGRLAFVQFAAHGVSSIKSIGQAIKLSIIDALYQLTVRKWVISIQASILASLGSGAANAAGSLFSNQAMAAGTTGLGSLSSLFGSAGSVFGGGAGAGAGTAFIGGPGTALGGSGLSGAAGGLFSGAGAAVPAIGAAFALAGLGSSFGAGKSIFGIKGDSILNFLPFAPGLIGILAGLFGKGPKQYGPQLLNGTFSEQGFQGNFQADWTRKVGIFGGKKRGTTDFPISPDQVNSLNATVTGITDVFDTLIKTTGDADRSLSGWTFNVRRQIDTEEQQKQLTDDLANSIGQKLVPELAALQQKGETMIDTATRMRQEFALVDSLLDITGKTLSQVGLASAQTRDSLVQLLGGVDAAGSALQAFYGSFYSDAERTASATRLLTKQLQGLGVDALPSSLEQYRKLVEAQDLNTSAGQAMFASLIQLAPAFAEVTNAMSAAAAAAEAAAQKVADSIQLLTTDSFATLFDYTKYIRLAANAGVTAAQPAGPVFQPTGQTYMPSFAIGTNEVPHDMTANIHRGERIIPAADNRELMRRLKDPNEGMKAMAEEINKLREDNRAQAAALVKAANQIAKTNDKLLKLSEQWDSDGLPQERVV